MWWTTAWYQTAPGTPPAHFRRWKPVIRERYLARPGGFCWLMTGVCANAQRDNPSTTRRPFISTSISLGQGYPMPRWSARANRLRKSKLITDERTNLDGDRIRPNASECRPAVILCPPVHFQGGSSLNFLDQRHTLWKTARVVAVARVTFHPVLIGQRSSPTVRRILSLARGSAKAFPLPCAEVRLPMAAM
jgi:hypothetical protein